MEEQVKVSVVVYCDDVSEWNTAKAEAAKAESSGGAKQNIPSRIQEPFDFRMRNTIQELHYSFAFDRDEVGKIYGGVEHVMIDFTVRAAIATSKVFYAQLKNLGTGKYSFIFDPVYDDKDPVTGARYLASFDAALVAEGYVVDLEEVCTTDTSQAMLRGKILASSISYYHFKDTNPLTLKIIS